MDYTKLSAKGLRLLVANHPIIIKAFKENQVTCIRYDVDHKSLIHDNKLRVLFFSTNSFVALSQLKLTDRDHTSYKKLHDFLNWAVEVKPFMFPLIVPYSMISEASNHELLYGDWL